ncbi:hypothetical protein GYMLUDRAFT_382757 [Collybiopsis luxurians FD-317 M1]|nr:hypothetical protein GYMLUDRAFT_382757 [Collybiopsis luxurians FD-317 M1]
MCSSSIVRRPLRLQKMMVLSYVVRTQTGQNPRNSPTFGPGTVRRVRKRVTEASTETVVPCASMLRLGNFFWISQGAAEVTDISIESTRKHWFAFEIMQENPRREMIINVESRGGHCLFRGYPESLQTCCMYSYDKEKVEAGFLSTSHVPLHYRSPGATLSPNGSNLF